MMREDNQYLLKEEIVLFEQISPDTSTLMTGCNIDTTLLRLIPYVSRQINSRSLRTGTTSLPHQQR